MLSFSLLPVVFSLGMLMFELLSLERPYFDAKDRFERNQFVIDGVRPKFPRDCAGLESRYIEICIQICRSFADVGRMMDVPL
tara:strand:- start:335 stop:580 length:246 start_codon:yes stop_codon:yes gene_type:complete